MRFEMLRKWPRDSRESTLREECIGRHFGDREGCYKQGRKESEMYDSARNKPDLRGEVTEMRLFLSVVIISLRAASPICVCQSSSWLSYELVKVPTVVNSIDVRAITSPKHPRSAEGQHVDSHVVEQQLPQRVAHQSPSLKDT